MQFALGGNPRIQLAQAARRRVARIGKQLLAGCLLSLVQGQKIGFQHQHFAAHFDQFRHLIALQTQRDIGDGFYVLSDVFARLAVTTSRAAHQHAVLIQQAHRQTVELGFDHISGFRACQTVAYPFVEHQHFGMIKHAVLVLRRKGIGKRQHRHFVAHALKTVQRRTAYPLGRAVRQAQLGMGGFQRFQLAKQAVVFRIGYAGRIEGVIFISITVKLFGQRLDAGGFVHGIHIIDRRVFRQAYVIRMPV